MALALTTTTDQHEQAVQSSFWLFCEALGPPWHTPKTEDLGWVRAPGQCVADGWHHLQPGLDCDTAEDRDSGTAAVSQSMPAGRVLHNIVRATGIPILQ